MIWTIIFRSMVLLLLSGIAGLLLFVAFPGIGSGAGFTIARDALPGTPAPLIAPADVVTIVLTAATMVLAGVALIISLLAFVGYEQMRRMVETKATDIASRRLDDYIKARQDEAFQARGLEPADAVDEMAAALAGQPNSGNPSREEVQK